MLFEIFNCHNSTKNSEKSPDFYLYMVQVANQQYRRMFWIFLLSYLPCSHIWLNLDHRHFGYSTKLRKIKNLNHCSERSQNRTARSPAGIMTLTSGSRQARQSTTLVRMEDRRNQSEARLSSFVVCQIKNSRILVSWMIHFPLILMDDLNSP